MELRSSLVTRVFQKISPPYGPGATPLRTHFWRSVGLRTLATPVTPDEKAYWDSSEKQRVLVSPPKVTHCTGSPSRPFRSF